eukprot:g790.t1
MHMAKTGLDRTKVVVRKLPPYLKQEDFQTELDKHALDCYNWFIYCPSKASSKKVNYSRAYLSFKEPQGVLDFKSKFDGFVFVGARGAQYKCSVEYAPYQRIPKFSSKKDPREGTIHKDPDYQAFVENLDKGPVMLPSAQKQFEEELSQKLAHDEGEDGIVTTPLMDYIVNKHLAKAAHAKQREAKHKEAKQRESRNSRKSKAKSLPPLNIKTKLSAKLDSSEKIDSKPSGSIRGRRNPRVGSGQDHSRSQTFKKKTALIEGKSETLEDTSESSKTSSAFSRNPDGNHQSHRGGNKERGGRGYSRRGGRSEGRGGGSSSNPMNRPNVKVVWIPKADKTRSE